MQTQLFQKFHDDCSHVSRVLLSFNSRSSSCSSAVTSSLQTRFKLLSQITPPTLTAAAKAA